MTSSFSQYPLFQKAYDRQCTLFHARNGGAKPSFTRFAANIVRVAEKYLNRAAAEKEGIMVVALLMISPGIYGDKDHMTEEYSPQIAKAVQVMLNGGMEEAIKTDVDLQEGLMIVVAATAEDVLGKNIQGSMSEKGIANMRALRQEMSLISHSLGEYLDRLADDLSKLVHKSKPPGTGPRFSP